MRSALLLGIACATALPLIGFAQGVPIIDGTRVSNLISRLAEQAQDFVKQEEKLGQQTRLNEIEDEQLAAYEREDDGEGLARNVTARGQEAELAKPDGGREHAAPKDGMQDGGAPSEGGGVIAVGR